MAKKPKARETDRSTSSGQPGDARSKPAHKPKVPDHAKPLEPIKLSLASDYAKQFEGIKVPLTADYAKLFEPIKLPLASDYAKLFEGIKVPLAADYAQLFEPIKPPLASDYAKLFEGIKVPLTTDYAQLFEPIKLPLASDYAKLFESIKLPTSTETTVSVSFDQGNELREEINTFERTSLSTRRRLRPLPQAAKSGIGRSSSLDRPLNSYKRKSGWGFCSNVYTRTLSSNSGCRVSSKNSSWRRESAPHTFCRWTSDGRRN